MEKLDEQMFQGIPGFIKKLIKKFKFNPRGRLYKKVIKVNYD